METSGTFVFMPTDTTPHMHNKQIKKGVRYEEERKKNNQKNREKQIPSVLI